MCKMRVVVLREMLGARETGWTLWDGKQVMEMTSKQITDSIAKGTKICGLTVGKSGALEPDKEGFYCSNVMEHRHCGSYAPMLDEGCMANLFYICIGKHEESGKVLYDCISTKMEQLSISEADMKAYLKIGIVSAGIKEINGELVLADLEFKKEETKVEEESKPAVATEEKPVTVEKTETKQVKVSGWK